MASIKKTCLQICRKRLTIWRSRCGSTWWPVKKNIWIIFLWGKWEPSAGACAGQSEAVDSEESLQTVTDCIPKHWPCVPDRRWWICNRYGWDDQWSSLYDSGENWCSQWDVGKAGWKSSSSVFKCWCGVLWPGKAQRHDFWRCR